MTLRTRSTTAGLAKQSAKDSPETDPLYTFGLLGGTAANIEVEEEDVDETASDRMIADRSRTAVMPSSSLSMIAMPNTIGLLLLAATGAVDTTGSDPYTHVFTPTDDVPYFTVFNAMDGEVTVIEDAKVGSLELSFDGTSRAEVTAELSGCDAQLNASAFTATDSHESPEGGNFLRGVGGSFNFDGASANVESATVTLSNELSPYVLADSVLPSDVPVTNHIVGVSLTVVPADLSDWHKIVTGTGAGTTVSDNVFRASADFQLTDGTNTLDFAANTGVWMATHPEASPDGEPARLELEGVVTRNSGGDPYTFTLVNSVTSY